MPTVRTAKGVELNYEVDDYTDEWSPATFDLETELTIDAYLDDLRTIFDAVGADRVHYCQRERGHRWVRARC